MIISPLDKVRLNEWLLFWQKYEMFGFVDINRNKLKRVLQTWMLVFSSLAAA